MNELLQKHGCSNVFTIPDGLKELMADITREVLRAQPKKIYNFIADYLSVLLITREHGILAVKILDELCDCKATVSDHLMQLGLEETKVDELSKIIKEEVECFEPIEGKEKVRELQIMKRVLKQVVLDEEMSAKVCQIARNAYRDYWYRKKLLQKNLKVHPDEPWEIAAQHTLQLYIKTKPSMTELNRATQKIQAAYKGYHVRRSLLRHLKPRPKSGPKVELPGPPLDVAASREINLGPVISIQVKEDDMSGMFASEAGQQLGLPYDTQKTITHIEEPPLLAVKPAQSKAAQSTAALETGPRKSVVPQAVPEQSFQKITFAEAPPVIIAIQEAPSEMEQPAVPDAEPEIPEDIQEPIGDPDSVAASATSSEAITADATDIEDEGDGGDEGDEGEEGEGE